MREYRQRLMSSACVTAVCASMLAVPVAAIANPTGGTVSAGSASISSSGNTLTVNQSSSKAVIDWRGFDIAAGETTQFIQQMGSSSIAVNRVNSTSASVINGNLSANGNIVIINQNGVVFGRGANVNVNSLVVSTADIDNNQFMNGNGQLVFNKPGNPSASIINNGTITAAQAGLVGFVAPNVVNNGVITARLGKVQLASGDTATVDLYGDGLLSVRRVPFPVVTKTLRSEGWHVLRIWEHELARSPDALIIKIKALLRDAGRH